MRDWELENLPNGKEISVVPFLMEEEEYPLKELHNYYRTELPGNYLTI